MRLGRYSISTVKLALMIVILGGALLRLLLLSSNPVALNQDEAVGGYDAFCVATTLKDHHGNFLPVLFESFEDWVSPVLTYLTVPFVKILGLSEFSIRLVVGLAGSATLVLMYLFLRNIGIVEPVAVVGTALLAIAPWHIVLSRWAIPPAIVPFTLMLTLWLASRTSKPKDNTWTGWLAFAASACVLTYSYPTQKLFAPLFVFVIVVVFLYPRWKAGAAIFTGYAVSVLPMYWLALRDPRRYNARFNDVALDFHQPGVLGEVIGRYGEYWLSDFHFGRGDTDAMHHVPGTGAMYPVVATLFYFGIAVVLANLIGWKSITAGVSRRIGIVLLSWLALFPLPASLTRDHMHLLRAVHGLPAVVVFSSIGLAGLLNLIVSTQARRLGCAVLCFVLVLEGMAFSGEYWGRYREGSKGSFQYGLRQVYEKAIEIEGGYQHVRVSSDINTPYIFYLFVSRKDPATIDYREINEHVDGRGNWLYVSKIGKWDFSGFSEEADRDAQEIYRSESQGRVWHRLLKKGDTLFIR